MSETNLTNAHQLTDRGTKRYRSLCHGDELSHGSIAEAQTPYKEKYARSQRPTPVTPKQHTAISKRQEQDLKESRVKGPGTAQDLNGTLQDRADLACPEQQLGSRDQQRKPSFQDQ